MRAAFGRLFVQLIMSELSTKRTWTDVSLRPPFAGDTAYGAVRLLRWLVDRITPHVPVGQVGTY